ncbi:MAG: 3-hydroxy-3-methylglutaryl-CoA reductase, partial [Deltaproteobacteria bacterium]|nr:3-hydroxy-3-methylglutaryl-CoA reductase [Deltaproteobacteria bacterium]
VPHLEKITAGKVGLRILTNLADQRLVTARVSLPVSSLAMRDYVAEEVSAGIVSASRFAELDPYRATTHNKGIMNGVDAVLLATGNDWRAVEAGAHAFAAQAGTYRPLCTWELDRQDLLRGQLRMPMAVGIVGGATQVHPSARLALDIMGVKKANELACIAAAVGMANNLAALRALATEGIQKGHMRLHERSRDLIADSKKID